MINTHRLSFFLFAIGAIAGWAFILYSWLYSKLLLLGILRAVAGFMALLLVYWLALLYNGVLYLHIAGRLRRGRQHLSRTTVPQLRALAPRIPYRVRGKQFLAWRESEGRGTQSFLNRDPAAEVPALLAQFEFKMLQHYQETVFQPINPSERSIWQAWLPQPPRWEPFGEFFPLVHLRIENPQRGSLKPLCPWSADGWVPAESYVSLALARSYLSGLFWQKEWTFLWLQVTFVEGELNWQFEVTRLDPRGGWQGDGADQTPVAPELFRIASTQWKAVLRDFLVQAAAARKPPPTVPGRRSAD